MTSINKFIYISCNRKSLEGQAIPFLLYKLIMELRA